jgi:hypothetical protein
VNPGLALIFDEARFSEAIHKKLARDRMVPIISAGISWLISGSDSTGMLSTLFWHQLRPIRTSF